MAIPDVVLTIGAKDKTGKAINSAGGKFAGLKSKIGGAMGGIVGAMNPVTLAAGALAGGLFAGVKALGGFLEKGDRLDKLSQQLGITVEAVQELGFAAEQSGASTEDVTSAFAKLAKKLPEILDGTSPLIAEMADLGIEVDKLFAEGDTPDQMFAKLADAIAGVEDPMAKLTIAQDLFGGSGVKLLPLLNAGSEGIAELRQQASDTGNVMSGEAATAAAMFNDKLNILKNGLSGIGQKVIGVLVPALLTMVSFLMDDVVPYFENNVIPTIKEIARVVIDVLNYAIGDVLIPTWKKIYEEVVPKFVALYTEHIKPFVDNIVGLFGSKGDGEGGGSGTSLTGVINVLKTVFEITFDIIATVVTVAFDIIALAIGNALVVIGGIITILTGVFTGDWDKVWSGIQAIGERVWDSISALIQIAVDLWTGIFAAFGIDIGAVFKDAANGVIGFMEGLANGVIGAINAILRAWNSLQFELPKVEFLGVSIGGNEIGVPKIGLVDPISIPRLGKGGIVMRPTIALIGENGPETVRPLRNDGAAELTINIYVSGDVYSVDDLRSRLASELASLIEGGRINLRSA